MEKVKRFHILGYTILITVAIVSLLWALNSNKSAAALERNIENGYNRAFFELADYIENIDIQLVKAQLAKTPAQLASISNDIFSEAAEAKSCLGQLPTSQISLENTSKFLSQVGDFTYVLSQNMIKGDEISQESYKTLSELGKYSTSLKNKLRDIQNSIYNGNIRISDLNNEKNDKNTVHANGKGILNDLENIEKSFDEYPSLIYDGPFSEHIENQKPKLLENKSEISQDEALKIAKDFLGERGRGLEFAYESNNVQIPVYTFSVNSKKEQITISITKNGGYVLYFLDNLSVESENINVSDATEYAIKFLESREIYDMVSSYYDKSANIATINFAYSQDGIKCYSDLIKVKVALDSGSIVGFESKGYIMNHRERADVNPKLSVEEAQSKISTSLSVESTTLALIPKDSLQEVLCYEFTGTFNDKNFIIYVNAKNGREEDILLLIESEEGILTV